MRKRVNLFGVDIDDISLDRATFLAYKSIRGGKRRSFFTPNLEMLSLAKKNEKIKALLNTASVSLPDGYSLKIIAKILGKDIKNIVAGIDFGERLLALAEKEEARVFLIGGRRGIARMAAKNIALKHPKINVCGVYHGYFKPEHMGAVCKMIERSRADVLIVCQGFPKQEYFSDFAIKKVKCVKVVACLGGTLDVWSGNVKRAPKSMRKVHLEWLWRILNEPYRCIDFVKSLDVFTSLFYQELEKT